MLEINLLEHEVIEVMPDAHVGRLKGVDQVERQRLENQPAVNDVARLYVVTMRQIEIRPDRAQLDCHRPRLFVPPDIELYFVAFEFALDYFRHVDARTFQLDSGVARDRMIVDRQKNVARLKTI